MGAERGCLENDKQEDNPMLAKFFLILTNHVVRLGTWVEI